MQRPNDTVLAETPVLKPPEGLNSQFINPPNEFKAVSIATYTICLFAATIAILIRIYTKQWVIHAIQLEDLMFVVAYLGIIPYVVLSVILMNLGTGVHQWNISLLTYITMAKYININSVLYGPVLCVGKVAVILQIRRIFTTANRNRIWWATIILLWVNVFFYIGNTLPLIFQCIPRRAIWDPFVEGRCVNINVAYLASSGINIATDLVLFFLPIWAVWHLQMATKSRLGISALFATALFAVISSILRLIYADIIVSSQDKTYHFQQMDLWGLAELTTVFLCGCFPIMPAFFKHIAGRASGRTAKSYGYTVSNQKTSKKTFLPSHSPRSDSQETTYELKNSFHPLENSVLGHTGSSSMEKSDGAHDDGWGENRKTTDIQTDLERGI